MLSDMDRMTSTLNKGKKHSHKTKITANPYLRDCFKPSLLNKAGRKIAGTSFEPIARAMLNADAIH